MLKVPHEPLSVRLLRPRQPRVPCTGGIIQRYLGKIGEPVFDRIDLHVEVPAVPLKELRAIDTGVISASMRERVLRAREARNFRGFINSVIPPSGVRALCALDEAGERTLELAMRKMGLSARAHDPLLKVARMIADLDNAERVESKHLAEEIQYVTLDRSYWG